MRPFHSAIRRFQIVFNLIRRSSAWDRTHEDMISSKDILPQTTIANGASIMVERVEAALPPFAAAWKKGSVPDAI